MSTYLKLLKALECLLDKTGESYWRAWLRKDVEFWETQNDVSHHLSAYGCMGSLNDLWISPLNGHAISEFQEPWINRLLTLLRNQCFRFAQAPYTEKSIKAIIIKTRFSFLSFLMHPWKISGEAQALENLTNIRLDGWRCLDCDFQEIQPRSIESTLAEVILPQQLSEARTGKDLIDVVDSTFSMEFPLIGTMREQLMDRIQKSGIVLTERGGWMRPCPRCGSHDTEVCQWESIRGKLLQSRR